MAEDWTVTKVGQDKTGERAKVERNGDGDIHGPICGH